MTALGPIAPGALGVDAASRARHRQTDGCRGERPRSRCSIRPMPPWPSWRTPSTLGLRGIVDMTPADYGRDPEAILLGGATRARACHRRHRPSQAPACCPLGGRRSVAEIAAQNIDEIRNGIGGHRDAGRGHQSRHQPERDHRVSRSGCCVPPRRRIWRPARRSRPIPTRAPWRWNRSRSCVRKASAPERVIIGHLDFALDEDYLLRVLDTGAFVSFDQVSKTKYASDEARAAMLAKLAARGHPRPTAGFRRSRAQVVLAGLWGGTRFSLSDRVVPGDAHGGRPVPPPRSARSWSTIPGWHLRPIPPV